MNGGHLGYSTGAQETSLEGFSLIPSDLDKTSSCHSDMSTADGSEGTTGERSHNNQVPFTAEFPKMLTKSSARFGNLSHHSFFSRHNPHPHRVRHIQGLNGGPICMVRDDWFVTSSLFPHPLLKSHILRKAAQPTFGFPLAQNLYGVSGNQNKSALISEAWRDELKELAAKVSLSSQAPKDKKEDQPEDEYVRRKTQYSAETGRLIPPSTRSYQCKSSSQNLKHSQPFHDQELTVLELLCQILQTDSLSTVQQWLLLAGHREKDMVMGMLRQALDGVDLSGRHNQRGPFYPGASLSGYVPSYVQPWRKPRKISSRQVNPTFSDDKPERIGEAEVLEVHAGAQNQDPLPQRDASVQYSIV
ncbi:protein TBATA [Parambassis ranga]|uniref:Protein TBATA n=1 Tax=Parambassis ranga TaxID=210632 RepID=A0A6P7K9V5_9TELE|nr:protein TBATA [Parambassis ranga]